MHYCFSLTHTLRHASSIATLLACANLAANCLAALPSIQGRKLFYADGQPFQIRAIDYSPVPIGLTRPVNDAQIHTVPIMQRDGPLLAELGANTLRIYGALNCDTGGNAVTILSADFVREAARQGMWIVAGTQIDPATDFGNATIRNKIIAAHMAFAHQFKAEPNILMWAPGNEVNFFAPNNQLANWNSLLNAIAAAIKTEQGGGSGPGFGPYVCGITNFANRDGSIGVAPQSAVPNVDIWSCNVFNGPTYGALFAEVEARSTKPFWVAECGIDSYDNTNHVENETTQALFVRSLWREIETRSDIACGAAIGFWLDEWWKAGSPSTHDTAGAAFGHAPDNFTNEEWLGITRPSVNPGAGPDLLQKKAAWFAIRDVWAKGSPAGFSGIAPFEAKFDAFTETNFTYNNYGGFHFGIYGTEAGAQDFRVSVGVTTGASAQAGDSALRATGSLPKGASFTYFSVIFTLFPASHLAGHDFTSFDKIRFDARLGAADAYARFNLRLEDSEGSAEYNNKEVQLPVLTTTFQHVEIPLSSFITGGGQLVNLAKLAQIVVNARTDQPPAGNYKLDLIIDNLEIVKTAPTITQPTIQLRTVPLPGGLIERRLSFPFAGPNQTPWVDVSDDLISWQTLGSTSFIDGWAVDRTNNLLKRFYRYRAVGP